MTHTSTEQERALFEAVASDDGKWPKAIERDAKGNYLLLTTANGWMWWQAARRAPAAPHPPSDAPQGWTPISESLPDFMEFCDWLMPMTDAKRECWILANESMATASVPGQATHWRKAQALPELMAAEPRQKKSNSVEFEGIKTAPQAQEKHQ